VENILETVDRILVKEHISRELFLKYRGKYVGLESRMKYDVCYANVN